MSCVAEAIHFTFGSFSCSIYSTGTCRYFRIHLVHCRKKHNIIWRKKDWRINQEVAVIVFFKDELPFT